jgi:hypothetical protein
VFVSAGSHDHPNSGVVRGPVSRRVIVGTLSLPRPLHSEDRLEILTVLRADDDARWRRRVELAPCTKVKICSARRMCTRPAPREAAVEKSEGSGGYLCG